MKKQFRETDTITTYKCTYFSVFIAPTETDDETGAVILEPPGKSDDT